MQYKPNAREVPSKPQPATAHHSVAKLLKTKPKAKHYKQITNNWEFSIKRKYPSEIR